MNFHAWLDAVRNIPTDDWKFLFLLTLLVVLLYKIKVRRPRPRDSAAPRTETEETLSREQRKGQRGEDNIADILQEAVSGQYEVFRNVYVPYRDATSEIDLLMVHEKGVIVFESKNYAGLISGSMDALNWAHIYPNRKKYLFYNPVRQNRNHIKALSQYLQLPADSFCSFIVFSDRCTLQRVPENTPSVVITQAAELAEQLEHTLSVLPVRYSGEDIGRIAAHLLPLTNVTQEVKRQHVRDIQDAQTSDTCPFCGAPLVLREGHYNSFFWGCSSYPRCKFTRNV